MNLNLIKSGTLAALLISTAIAHASDNTHVVKLHVNANGPSQDYVQNICITLNKGFTKSCGDGAQRDSSSGSKEVSVYGFNLYRDGPLGYDDSCRTFRHGFNTPKEKGLLELFTTVQFDEVNHVNVVSITNCSTAWTPY